jgi:hypothetical protein
MKFTNKEPSDNFIGVGHLKNRCLPIIFKYDKKNKKLLDLSSRKCYCDFSQLEGYYNIYDN